MEVQGGGGRPSLPRAPQARCHGDEGEWPGGVVAAGQGVGSAQGPAHQASPAVCGALRRLGPQAPVRRDGQGFPGGLPSWGPGEKSEDGPERCSHPH